MKKQQQLKKRKVHRNRIISLLFVFIFIIGIVFVQVRANNASLEDSKRVLQEKQEALTKAKNTNKRLKIMTKELKNEEYIKKWIRSKYKYSKDNETIFNFGSN